MRWRKKIGKALQFYKRYDKNFGRSGTVYHACFMQLVLCNLGSLHPHPERPLVQRRNRTLGM